MTENLPSAHKHSRRELSAAELELWLDATRSVARTRLAGSRPCPPLKLSCKPEPNLHGAKPIGGAKAKQPPRKAVPRPRLALQPIERRLRQRLSRGQLLPDANLDLHGMRREEASAALRSFLLRAQNDGARLVLVVTGKGNRPAQGDATPGVLRKCVPEWLCGTQFHSIISGFEEAARPHGGSGALYIRLRRRRLPAAKSDP